MAADCFRLPIARIQLLLTGDTLETVILVVQRQAHVFAKLHGRPERIVARCAGQMQPSPEKR